MACILYIYFIYIAVCGRKTVDGRKEGGAIRECIAHDGLNGFSNERDMIWEIQICINSTQNEYK